MTERSDYPGRIVLIGFFRNNGNAGTRERRERYSDELFDFFDKHIVKACSKATPAIEPSAEIRATIAVLAERAPGDSKAEKAQVATQAYFEFRGM